MTKRCLTVAILSGVAWLALASPVVLSAEQRPPADLEEAQKWFREGLERAQQKSLAFETNPQGVPYITWTNKDGTRAMLLISWLTSVTLPTQQEGLWKVHYTLEGDSLDLWEGSASRERVERYREALLFLGRNAQSKFEAIAAASLESLRAEAEAWRALPEKPKMPDDAYSHKVLAEEAYRNKDFNKALAHYQLALSTFPTWPEGQFNCALIAGELQHYRIAVVRMKKYLLLAPEAADAQSAKDKIIIWQDKITHL